MNEKTIKVNAQVGELEFDVYVTVPPDFVAVLRVIL